MAGVLADAVLATHLGFILFVALGGFAAWRWPRWIAAHAAAVAWGVAAVAFGLRCPLTSLEETFRRRAGEPGLAPTGFVDHYIEGVVYPDRYAAAARTLLAVVVAVSWAGFWWRRRNRVSASMRGWSGPRTGNPNGTEPGGGHDAGAQRHVQRHPEHVEAVAEEGAGDLRQGARLRGGVLRRG